MDQALTLLSDDAQKFEAPNARGAYLPSFGPRTGILFSFLEVPGQATTVPRPP